MSRVFDVVLASNDMSLDRVLGAGLPVAMVFYSKDLPTDLRHAMDELAQQYAGKVLVVMLAQNDAAQAISRFGVLQFPALVTFRDGKTLTGQESLKAEDLKSHVVFLVGEGPMPNVHTSDQSPVRSPSTTSRQTTASHPIHVHEADFEREVLRANLPVLVDFWAPWCGPCRMVEPTLNKMANELSGILKIVKVNVDENPNLAARYGAMSIPMMMVIDKGREVDRWVGALPEGAIHSRVTRWIQRERQVS